jgi:hypothetical protein
MKLTAKQRGVLRQLLAAENVSFSALVEMAGLDKRTDFVGNNLRTVDFGSADLTGYNFFDADLTNARMDKATGKEGLVLTGAVTTGTTGLPAHGLPGGSERRDRSGLPTLVRIPAGTFIMARRQRKTGASACRRNMPPGLPRFSPSPSRLPSGSGNTP